jgi:two-component system response regulator MprA
VVDGDEGVRESLRHVLGWEGYAVDTAANGLEALAAISRQSPDVVILDVHVLTLDGPGLGRALRQRRSRLPIIAMSAAIDARRRDDEIGAVAYLEKPFRLDDLIRALQSALTERRATAGAGGAPSS